MRLPRLCFLIALTMLSACASQRTTPQDTAWVSALRSGGYVILIRHAATDWRESDSNPANLDLCANQRNLSAQGREQAALIGEGFRALHIPLGKIETSEYCRCIDTARIAFGYGTTNVDLTSVNGTDPVEASRRVTKIRQMISDTPNRGTNTVLVSHMAMIFQATGVGLEEGEAAVFNPKDGGTAEYLGKISPEGWRQEVSALKSTTAKR